MTAWDEAWFDFGNKKCPVPVDCDYEVTIKQAVPEVFITNNNYLNQNIRTEPLPLE